MARGYRNRAKEARSRNKANALAKDVIGTKIKVRVDSNTIFSGTIVAAEFLGWRPRTCSKIAQFTVTVEGPTGLRKTLTLEQFPRRS